MAAPLPRLVERDAVDQDVIGFPFQHDQSGDCAVDLQQPDLAGRDARRVVFGRWHRQRADDRLVDRIGLGADPGDRFKVARFRAADHDAALAMTLRRKSSHFVSSLKATNSSALCAWSIEPGPQITAGMPARWKCPASVP